MGISGFTTTARKIGNNARRSRLLPGGTFGSTLALEVALQIGDGPSIVAAPAGSFGERCSVPGSLRHACFILCAQGWYSTPALHLPPAMFRLLRPSAMLLLVPLPTSLSGLSSYSAPIPRSPARPPFLWEDGGLKFCKSFAPQMKAPSRLKVRRSHDSPCAPQRRRLLSR